ncbi:MAG: ATP-dependent sacrificial sulfur transferase LarE [Mycobacteriales bacterium]
MVETKLRQLDRSLRAYGSVVVAFSGGADSAFLLAAAQRALGASRVVAATAVSPSLPTAELAAAAAFAEALGVRHETPATDELARPGYRDNAPNRCYFCKSELIETLRPLATRLGIEHVATGTNADDAAGGFRPGIRAARERSAVTPLLDAGLTKADVRAASRAWGLRTWDKPAAACLSSRVAYGVPVTSAALARVERAETGLRDLFDRLGLAVRDLRVRDLGGNIARVEVDRARASDVSLLPETVRTVVAAGFSDAFVDPQGFRSGAMNESLADAERWR